MCGPSIVLAQGENFASSFGILHLQSIPPVMQCNNHHHHHTTVYTGILHFLCQVYIGFKECSYQAWQFIDLQFILIMDNVQTQCPSLFSCEKHLFNTYSHTEAKVFSVNMF